MNSQRQIPLQQILISFYSPKEQTSHLLYDTYWVLKDCEVYSSMNESELELSFLKSTLSNKALKTETHKIKE